MGLSMFLFLHWSPRLLALGSLFVFPPPLLVWKFHLAAVVLLSAHIPPVLCSYIQEPCSRLEVILVLIFACILLASVLISMVLCLA